MGKRTVRTESPRANVLGMPLDKLDMVEVLRTVERFIGGGSHQIITANSEIFYKALRDEDLKRIINRADLVLADGAGLVWAADFLGDKVPERVAGVDLMTNMVELAARAGHKTYFLGAAPGITEKAVEVLKARYPTLNVAGCHHGFFKGDEEGAIIAGIRESGAHILFVALGAPRAEKWIAANHKKLNVPVMMGVGGSFDIIAGAARRAPQWMQRAGLEWFFRLIWQPSRAGRMLALPKFVLAVLRWRFSHGSID